MEILKKTWKWIALGAVLLSGSLLTMSVDTKSSLENCFSDHQIEWSAENRAAEAAKLGIWGWKDTSAEQDNLASLLCSDGLGYTVVTDYQKALSAPMTAAQSFVPVTSMTLRDGQTLNMSTLGSVVFLTLEPGATNEEIVACTDLNTVTKQFTGCTRGLAFSGTSTAAVAANAKTHSSGSTIVMSNVHYVYQQFLDKNGDAQYVTSTVIFNNLPRASSTTAVPTLPQELATMFYVDQQVAGGFSCSSASSTLGITCSGTPAVFGINLNSTSSGLYFSGTNASQLTVKTSSTGGIVVNGVGSVILDTSDSFTWTGSNTISAGSGHLYVPTPADVAEATPKNYVDAADLGNTATGTAGVTIAAGQVLYISSTNTLFLADSDVTTTTYPFIGIALTGASAGNQVTYARQDGIATGLSGLTAGSTYYISGTAGSLTTTPGTVPARVLRALTTTSGIVLQPTFTATASGTAQVLYDGTVVAVTTGFVPTKINLLCEAGSGSNSTGSWWRNSNGTNGQFSRGADSNALPYERHSANLACTQRTAGGIFSISVATSTSGFTLTPSNPGGAITYPVYWEAEYFSE